MLLEDFLEFWVLSNQVENLLLLLGRRSIAYDHLYVLAKGVGRQRRLVETRRRTKPKHCPLWSRAQHYTVLLRGTVQMLLHVVARTALSSSLCLGH